MIALHLLRHAHAGDPAKWESDDADRPLSEKGRRQAKDLGGLLALIDGELRSGRYQARGLAAANGARA